MILRRLLDSLFIYGCTVCPSVNSDFNVDFQQHAHHSSNTYYSKQCRKYAGVISASRLLCATVYL